jgi:hypothetical protein
MGGVGLVIARYLEDISWSNKFDVDRFIYNKSLDEIENSIKLENIGLEPHTFLYHIINNYDNLSDYTFFLQGTPHDHDPDIENKINSYINGEVNDFELIGIDHTTESLKNYSFVIPSHVSCFGCPPKYPYFYFKAGGQFVISKEKILSNPIEFYQYLYNLFYLDPSDPLYVTHGDKSVIGLPHFFERFWSKIFGENNEF